MPESIAMTMDVCERLLRAAHVGRVAICTPNGPHVVPVNYWVHDQAVMFRTSPYSLLGTYARNSLLALEIDHLGEVPNESWSVIARGRCHSVDDHDQIAMLEATSPPRPWAAGTRNLYLAIPWSEISGRRLGLRQGSMRGSSVDLAIDGEAE